MQGSKIEKSGDSGPFVWPLKVKIPLLGLNSVEFRIMGSHFENFQFLKTTQLVTFTQKDLVL